MKTNHAKNLFEEMNRLNSSSEKEREEIIETLVKRKGKRIQWAINSTYNVYGATEMSGAYTTKEALEDAAKEAIRMAAKNWDPSKIEGEKLNLSAHVYVNRYIDGEVKKYYSMTNKVSNYYACWLIYLKKAGMDIWSPKDDELVSAIKERNPHIKYPTRLLYKLRYVFSSSRGGSYEPKIIYTKNDIITYFEYRHKAKPSNVRAMLCLYSEGVDLWSDDESAIQIIAAAGYAHPEKKLRKIRADFDKGSVERDMAYLKDRGLFPDDFKMNMPPKKASSATQDGKKTECVPALEESIMERKCSCSARATAARYLTRVTGISEHYARFYVVIDGYSENVWESDDEVLAAIISKEFRCKRPLYVLGILRKADKSAVASALSSFKKEYQKGRVDSKGRIKKSTRLEVKSSLTKKKKACFEDSLNEEIRKSGVSRYFSRWIGIFKRYDADLWNTDDELLKDIIVLENPAVKNPNTLIKHLREKLDENAVRLAAANV